MARREAFITIDAEGRDKGKVFKITEMPADAGERWAIRLLLALANSGVDLPANAFSAGMAGLAAVGLRALFKLRWIDAEPLLDEMMLCVSVCPRQGDRTITTGLFPDSIEEIATRVRLRKEVLLLHTGFSLPAASSTSASTAGQTPD
jgi:hypothetical protein